LTGGGALTAVGALVASAVLGRHQGLGISARWESGPHLQIVLRESQEVVEEVASSKS
jgi:hypothetical protein